MFRHEGMNSTQRLTIVAIVLLSAALYAQQPKSNQSDSAWKTIETELGRAGSAQQGDVYKISLPRSDLHVRVGDVEIKPALALGGWLAFKQVEGGTMVMGDLVLTEDEVAPITAKLQAAGIEQTAIHNHVLHETPRVMYMHVEGHGDQAKLARSLHDALSVTKLPPATPPKPSELTGLNQKDIEQALGHQGKVNGGVLQVSVPRAEKITDSGMEIPPSMGTATSLNFQPTGDGKAAITGDFVLIASEVNPVIHILNENGIAVTALHSHMLNESPRLFFMHFWANADAVKLAKALHEALNKTSSASSASKSRQMPSFSSLGQKYSTAKVLSVNEIGTFSEADNYLNSNDRPLTADDFAFKVAVQDGCTKLVGRYDTYTESFPSSIQAGRDVLISVSKHQLLVQALGGQELPMRILCRQTVEGCSPGATH